MGVKSAISAEEQFRVYAAQAESFSRSLMARSGTIFTREPDVSANLNVEIAKAVFGKWGLEILSVLYSLKAVGFEELRRHLGGIRPSVLSVKLLALEGQGLVSRTVLPTHPTRVQYSLTRDGLIVVKIGEPVILFFGFAGIGPWPAEKSREM